MNMPVSKRKCDFEWTYVDEITSKAHKIIVYRLLDGEDVKFLAEARTPFQISGTDENPNVLRKRMVAQLAAGRSLEWEQGFLLTTSNDDFGGDPLDFKSGKRNYHGVGILFETFEDADVSDVGIHWRGVAGKSARFSGQAKPGRPPTGRTDRGGMTRIFKNTPEDRTRLQYIRGLFLDVAQGLGVIANPKLAGQVAALLDKFMGYRNDDDEHPNGDSGVWGALAALGAKSPNGNGNNHKDETTCPPSDSKSLTAVTPASAPAGHA
jgi:hypothetical protein